MRARTTLAAGAVDLLAGHEGCGVLTQLCALTAARGEQDRCCSCWRAMYKPGKDRKRCKRIASGSAWRLGSSTSTGLRFSVIGRNHIDAALSTTTQPCPRFTLTPLKSCFKLLCSLRMYATTQTLILCSLQSVPHVAPLPNPAALAVHCCRSFQLGACLGADGKEQRSCEMRVPMSAQNPRRIPNTNMRPRPVVH